MFSIILLLVQESFACDPSMIRWSSSSNRIYVEGPTTCTLTEIDSIVSSNAGIQNLGNNIWYLSSSLYIEDGAQLNLYGSLYGGDVDILRLKSENICPSTSYIEVKSQWGTVDINGVSITSWDMSGPDLDPNTCGRAFIRAVSDSTGNSYLYVENSDIGYLGFDASESYGVVWKVRGTDFTNVWVGGEIINSRLHDNWFGGYTYGAENMYVMGSSFDTNFQYGFDPHDDSDFLHIENNTFHHNGNHGFICSKRCNNLEVINNTSYSNTEHGIMLHSEVTNSLVAENTIEFNSGDGIAIHSSNMNTIQNNLVRWNNGAGIRLSVGSSGNSITGNTTSYNKYGIYFYKGSDIPPNGITRPSNNVVKSNIITSNTDTGLKIKDSDNNLFELNQIDFNVKGGELAGVSPFGNSLINNRFLNNTSYAFTIVSAPSTVMSGYTNDINGEVKLSWPTLTNETFSVVTQP